MDDVDEFISHYGKKGMKWGSRGTRKGPTDVEVRTKPGKKVKTSGGKRQSASSDAITVAKSRQKAKSSTTDSLSTKELQELVGRMNLEQQYSKLSSNRRGLGFKVVKLLLSKNGQKQAKDVIDAVNENRRVFKK